MVIALVIDTFNTNNNGTTVSAMRFAEVLKQRGHSIRVITCGDPSKSGPDPETGYEMYYVPEFKIPIVSTLAHKQHTLLGKPVRSTLKEAISGTDVVHIYEPWPLGGAAGRIARRFGIPTIAAFHVQPENITYNIGLGWFPPAAGLIYRLLNLFFYRKFTHIHCPSKFIATQLRKYGYKSWLHVISNGVHPDFKPSENARSNSRENFKILTVGRLSPEKRQDILIRAVKMSRYADRIELYFAGRGPWKKKLRRMAKRLPISPVFGYYEKDELIELMHKCDLYVHPSDVEIEGISCLEAISCGLVPVISDSKRSATSQFALVPESLFKAGSPAALAERIDYWLEVPERLIKTGERYARFAKEFSLERSVKRMEKLYSALADRRKNPYRKGRIYRVLSRVFYTGIATPLLYIWMHLFLGARIEGLSNLRGLRGGALTVCNHVHKLDSVLIALAFFPRKIIFTALPENLNSLWPGAIVRLLGAAAVPRRPFELKTFFDEMEFLLRKGQVVHFFPEGELVLYDTNIRSFKKGAFHLAAQARVPLVPMSISFSPPRGLRKLVRKKPVMVLRIGKPIYPLNFDPEEDADLRMETALVRMHELLSTAK